MIDRMAGFGRLIDILEYSCMGNLVKRFNSSTAKVIKKFGKSVTFTLSKTQTLKKLDKTISTSKTLKLITYQNIDRKIIEKTNLERFL